MAAAIQAVMGAVFLLQAADEPPEEPPGLTDEDAELMHTAMTAALEILPPAQRRVMEGVLGALLAAAA
jgi:hypothetical protein